MAVNPYNDPLAAYALLRVPGKPFVVTEWNSGQPNDFGSESLIMAAAYAAHQDWAGVWVFDYHSNGLFERDRIENFFSIDSHPTKMATAPAAALLFRRGDVAASQTKTSLAFFARQRMGRSRRNSFATGHGAVSQNVEQRGCAARFQHDWPRRSFANEQRLHCAFRRVAESPENHRFRYR
jgi:hypothetical protein